VSEMLVLVERSGFREVRIVVYLNDGILALDSSLDTVLRDLDIQIFALEVTRDLNGDF